MDTSRRNSSIVSYCLQLRGPVLVTPDLGLIADIPIYFLCATLLIQMVHLSCQQALKSGFLHYCQLL